MIRREAVREYATGSLWVLPGVSALVALLVGFAVSQIDVGPGSPLAPLAFQGTADDARTLLMNITSTVITVIALVLGLTVVALQLSSTQFSPRLLRNFLRDRPNQIVLSVFVATFVYAAAGLYTVGLAVGDRTEDFPRLAVSGALVLMFVSLAMVVYFADHLAHSIQVDAIGTPGRTETLTVVHGRLGWSRKPHPPRRRGRCHSRRRTPGTCRPCTRSCCCPLAGRHRLTIRLRVRVGEHIVAGTVLGWMWTPTAGRPDARPGDDPARPGRLGPHRLRTNPGAGRRVRHPATGRHGLQGPVPRGERPLHRGTGRRPPLGDLLRAGRPPVG